MSLDWANKTNIQFITNLYRKDGSYVKSIPVQILTIPDYVILWNKILSLPDGKQVKVAKVRPSLMKPTTTGDALYNNVVTNLKIINITPSDTQPSVRFDIHCEKVGSDRYGVVLSEADYLRLQHNVRVFAVLNIVHIQGVPNIQYPELMKWIGDNSIYKVPLNADTL